MRKLIHIFFVVIFLFANSFLTSLLLMEMLFYLDIISQIIKLCLHFLSVCNASEWSQCYESEGDCLKNRTVCSDVQVANCTSNRPNWSDWSSCSINSTGNCVQTRKRTAGCGEEMTDTVECQPQQCNSSE